MTALAFDEGLQMTTRLPRLLAIDSHESNSARPDESTPVTSFRLKTTSGEPSSKAARIACRRPVSALSFPWIRSTVVDPTRRDSIIGEPMMDTLPFLVGLGLGEERLVDGRVVLDFRHGDA